MLNPVQHGEGGEFPVHQVLPETRRIKIPFATPRDQKKWTPVGVGVTVVVRPSALRCAGGEQVFEHAQDGEHMHGVSLMNLVWSASLPAKQAAPTAC